MLSLPIEKDLQDFIDMERSDLNIDDFTEEELCRMAEIATDIIFDNCYWAIIEEVIENTLKER